METITKLISGLIQILSLDKPAKDMIKIMLLFALIYGFLLGALFT